MNKKPTEECLEYIKHHKVEDVNCDNARPPYPDFYNQGALSFPHLVEYEKQRAEKAEARVEELEALIKHIYHYGTILSVDDHKAMMNWSKNEQ